MVVWVYGEKFLMDMWFLFGTLPFTAAEDDNLEHPAQQQEEWRTMMIGLEFYWGLKNSAATFQATVSQPATTNLIDCPAWPPIRTPSPTTWSFELALGEIRTTKPEESAWSDVAIGKRSTPSTSTQRSTGLRWQNVAPLHQVALHLSLDFNTVWPQGRTYRTDRGSRSRTSVRWAVKKQRTATSERTYSDPTSKTRLAWTRQQDIFIPSRYTYSI
jgi:hypothetical protein